MKISNCYVIDSSTWNGAEVVLKKNVVIKERYTIIYLYLDLDQPTKLIHSRVNIVEVL